MILVSWIIPTYNESAILESMLTKLKNEYSGLDIEFIVADDGSTDNSKQIARDFLVKNKCGYVVGSSHLGRGGALIEGVLCSRADIVILSSADIIVERSYLENILHQSKNYELIMLSKNLRDSKITGRPLGRKYLSLTFNLLVRLLFRLPFRDTQGLKILKREALLDILSYCEDKGFVMDLELVVYANRLKFRILELPWALEFRRGKSIVVKSIHKMFINTAKLRLEVSKVPNGRIKLTNEEEVKLYNS